MPNDRPEPVTKEELPRTPSNTGKMPSPDELIEEIEGNLDRDSDSSAERDQAVGDMIRKGDRE